MSNAFVLGNGVSRLELSVNWLTDHGEIYGCNAIYREFAPTVLVAVDKPISEEIQRTDYALSNRMYTRRPLLGLGAQRIPHPYYGYSSGPVAAALAAIDNHTHVFLIGFDMGPSAEQKFNNVYANTQFYKKSSAPPTFTGNWTRQIVQVTKDFPECKFYRIFGKTTALVPEFQNIKNLESMPIEEFQNLLNNKKDF
jgi:hypothetical protein